MGYCYPVCPPACPPTVLVLPPYPQPPAPPPPSPLYGPIIGVTDGSNAKAGEVGEFVALGQTMAYAAYPTVTSNTLTIVTIPAGDWDLHAFATFGGPVGGATIYLNPVPTGVSNNMFAANWVGVDDSIFALLSIARGSFSVPTALAFFVEVDQSIVTGLPAGTATIAVEARRRR